MKKGRYSKEEEHYIKSNYWRLSPATIAERLGRSKHSVYEKAEALGLCHGVPKGYVAIRSVVASQPATRSIAKIAKREGVLRQAKTGHRLLCVPEKWLDDYLRDRMGRAENDEIAKREGWYTVKDIAAALGMSWRRVGVSIGNGRGRVGKAMKGVRRIRGSYGRWYYEPQATRLALARLGAHITRRAA